jgi:hypothetical protein
MQVLRETADAVEYCMTLDPDRLQVIIEKGRRAIYALDATMSLLHYTSRNTLPHFII